MLKVKSTIDAGIDAIRQYIPEDQTMTDLLRPILDSFFETDNRYPNVVVLEKIYSLREEIMSRLAQIENELENLISVLTVLEEEAE